MTEEERLEAVAVEMREVLRNEVDARTDAIFNAGITWNGKLWYGDKVHLDDYLQACQAIQFGQETEVLVKGKGDTYELLTADNVNDFYMTGKAFKLNTLTDGYKIKDLGGVISNGKTVKAIKDMKYEELVYWTDPRD